jgi:DNA-binding MurR/RpiR family transcriptional regulator
MRKTKQAFKPPTAPSEMATVVERLTPRRREIVRPVLSEPRSYVLLSLRGVARKLKSDPSTLLRTVQAMGFKQYRDFQRYLQERTIAFSTSFDTMEETSPVKNGVPGLISRSLKRDLDNLKQLRHSVDPSRVIDVAKRMYEARRILVLGGDMASSLALFLDYNLAMLGLNSRVDVGAGQIVHQTRIAHKRDVVIAVSFGRGLRQTVEGLKKAHEGGAFCVGISDSFVSPLARFSDQFFVTPSERVSFADSYVAAMAFLNALMVACANVQRRRSLAHIKEVAQEQKSGYRWYPEER